MGKVHSNGVVLPTGFKRQFPAPGFDDEIWEFVTDLQTIPNQFIGMKVFIIENESDYTLKSTGWQPDNPDLKKETLVTTGGTKVSQPTPTNFIHFTNQVDPTILGGLANPVDGKVVTIVNKTLQNLPILHENATATAVNRLFNINEQDLFVVVNGAAKYIYSASLSRWILTNIWGTDYFSTLVGDKKRAMSVTAEGYAVGDDIVDLKVWDTARMTNYTEAELNTTYPLMTKGQQVVCANITTGGITYEKLDDSSNEWTYILTPKVS